MSDSGKQMGGCSHGCEPEACVMCLSEELADLRWGSDLRWKADMRAIKRWQEANPGNDLTWPDHADLCVWLLGENDCLKEEIARVRGSKISSNAPDCEEHHRPLVRITWALAWGCPECLAKERDHEAATVERLQRETERLYWTKELPKEDGWFWWREDLSQVAIVLRVWKGRGVGSGYVNGPIENMGGEWCGPLQEPGRDVAPSEE